MEWGRGRRSFLEKGFPASPQICQAPSLKASVFIESLLPVFPGGPRPDDVVRAFFYGESRWGWDREQKNPAVKRKREGKLACRRLFVLLGCCMLVLG